LCGLICSPVSTSRSSPVRRKCARLVFTMPLNERRQLRKKRTLRPLKDRDVVRALNVDSGGVFLVERDTRVTSFVRESTGRELVDAMKSLDTTGQARGILRLGCSCFVAASVRHHGARPWHLEIRMQLLWSGERETPRGKAVAS